MQLSGSHVRLCASADSRYGVALARQSALRLTGEDDMTKNWFIAVLLCGAATAQAQDSGLSVSVGVRGWNTQWDTFSYAGNPQVVTQSPANEKFVLVPLLSVRYRDFVGSLSLYPSTDHSFIDGSTGNRKELDLNLGYYVSPGVAVTLGYKKLEQSDGSDIYALSGPVLGVNGTASLGRDFSLYGTFGLGRLKTTSASTVQFSSADYRLSEVGLAYTLATPSIAKAVTFTLGYRTQVLSSKDAAEGQDGRDLTQGLTLGFVTTF
jgi:hypothetical protein